MGTPKTRRGAKRAVEKTATAKRSTTGKLKLPGVKLTRKTSFAGEPSPDRFTLAGWWKDGLKLLLQRLVDFVGTRTRSSETTRELVGESLRQQFDEIREALAGIERVPRCLQLVLAYLRDVGNGSDPKVLGFAILEANRVVTLRGMMLANEWARAVPPLLNVEWPSSTANGATPNNLKGATTGKAQQLVDEGDPKKWTIWLRTKNVKPEFAAKKVARSSQSWTKAANRWRDEGLMENSPITGPKEIRLHKSVLTKFGIDRPDWFS